MRITLESNIAQVRAQVAQFSDRRFNAAMATALTRTAVQVRAGVQAELPRVLDRPTPYTLRQLRYVGASANNLAAAVGFNVVRVSDQRGSTIGFRDMESDWTPAGKYLQPNIDGGTRRLKRLEKTLEYFGALPSGWFVVPGQGANLDAYGNVSRGQVIQVLSQLRMRILSGFDREMSFDPRKQITAQRKAGGRFFVIPPGKGKQQPGIYQREFNGRNITPVFIFVRGATYRRRFDFDGLAKRLADQTLPGEVQRAVNESLARLSARSGA
jgi:hypothetical protein